MTTTVLERPVEDASVTTLPQQPDPVLIGGAWGLFCQYALTGAVAGLLTFAPGLSTNTTNPLAPGHQIVYRSDSATYRHAIPSLRARGWAFAQRMADEAKAAAVNLDDVDEDDDNIVDAPDSSIWEHLPATSWA
jgi:hypothetical protein